MDILQSTNYHVGVGLESLSKKRDLCQLAKFVLCFHVVLILGKSF